jgi:hypothetical protein
MRHARQHRTLNYWCEANTSWWFCQVRDLGRPFLSALSVRYLVAGADRKGAQDWTLVTRGRNLSLWENPNALPRAFAPDRVLRLDAGSRPPGAMAELADFRKAAAIEFDAWPGPGPGGGNANFRRNPTTGDRAEVSTRADGPDLVVTVESSEPTWIVVSETPWRGWRARIENGARAGERLELSYANVSMLAFEAPVGRSEVRLTFWPTSFTVGLVLAALAILALAAPTLAALALAARGRRRQAV